MNSEDVTRQPVVGMVGGGQLARMTAQAAVGLGIPFRVLATSADESAAQVSASAFVGHHASAADVLAFGVTCDVVTFDHEHVPQPVLAEIERKTVVRPSAAALRFAQDKLAMRERVAELGGLCPRFAPVATVEQVRDFVAAGPGWPVVLKAVSGGYDGKGVWICPDLAAAQDVLGHGVPLLAEDFVPFERELAVLVARSPKGQGASYPVVQTVQEDGVCREVIAPAPGLDPDVAVAAQRLGLTIAAGLDVTGLLAVEMFLTSSGQLMVNELAMRPHNSGHWTIDAAVTSQFEQHLRAVLDLPLGSPAMNAGQAVMVNILGGDDPDLYSRLVHVMAADPAVKVHLYGKRVRPGRKVGHVTVAGDPRDLERLRDRAWRAANYLSLGTEEPSGQPAGGRAAGPA